MNEGTGKQRQLKDVTNKANYRASPKPLEEIFAKDAYAPFHVINFDTKAKKRLMCPFEIEKEIGEKLDGKPKSIPTSGRDGLLIEVASKTQCEKIKNITRICDQKCHTKEHISFNGKKAIIYIQNLDITNLTSFRDGLIKEYPILEVTEVNWIKTRNENTRAFMARFAGNTLPPFIKVLAKIL